MNLKSLVFPIFALGVSTSAQAATILINNADFSSATGGSDTPANTATNWNVTKAGAGTVYYKPSETSGVKYVAYIQGSGANGTRLSSLFKNQ